MSRPGDHDDDVPFDPFDEEDDLFRPQRPLRDPLRPDLDPFRIPNDPFQFDDPLQGPSDPYAPPSDPYGAPPDPHGGPPDRTDAFEPAPGPPSPPQGARRESPPPPPTWPRADRPEPPPPAAARPEQPSGGAPGSEQQRQAPIPSRAARHQQKRRIPWRFSRGQDAASPPAAAPPTAGPAAPGQVTAEPAAPRPPTPGPRDPGDPRDPRGPRPGGPGDPRSGGPGGHAGPGGPGGAGGRGAPGPPGSTTGQFGRIPPSGAQRPPGGAPPGGPGGTTGPFDRIPDGGQSRPGGTTGQFGRIPGGGPRPGRPGGTTGPFDAVPGARAPGTTGPFERVGPERLGSTGEFPSPVSNGRGQETAAAAAATAEREARSRVDRGVGRSRSPQTGRQLPSLPKFEVPTGLARTTLGLVAILVLATTGLGVVTSALPKAKPPATPATAAPYSARWICPLLPNQSASIGMTNVGGSPATLRTTVVGAAGASQTPQKPLEAGGLRTMNVPAPKQPGYVQVEAFSAPIAVGSGGQASCASGPTDRWWIPAADTSLGASTSVVVANPDNDPAVVDLVPHVNQGALAAVAELFVPPRSAKVQTLSNGELIALRPAIEVIAKSGRVVAGAVISQKDEQKIFVPGQPTTRSQWSFAGGLAGTNRSTSVLITNPSASPLSVSVQVSTDQGTFRPGNDFDNPIPGGSSAAIQVPPLRIRGSGAFALRISSRDGANFVAALRVSTPTAAGDATYLDLGTGGSDRSWFVPAIPASKQVVLANLGNGPVSAQLGQPGAGKGGETVKVDPGKVIVRPVPSGAKSLEVATDQPGLLVAPLGGGLALAGAEIGGVPAGGPVVASGQAAE